MRVTIFIEGKNNQCSLLILVMFGVPRMHWGEDVVGFEGIAPTSRNDKIRFEQSLSLSDCGHITRRCLEWIANSYDGIGFNLYALFSLPYKVHGPHVVTHLNSLSTFVVVIDFLDQAYNYKRTPKRHVLQWSWIICSEMFIILSSMIE